jgi:hypothetical protein
MSVPRYASIIHICSPTKRIFGRSFQVFSTLCSPPGGAGFALYPQHTTLCRVRGQLPGDILQKRVLQQIAARLFAVLFLPKSLLLLAKFYDNYADFLHRL